MSAHPPIELAAPWQSAIERMGDSVWDWHLLTDTVSITGILFPQGNELQGSREGVWAQLIHPDDRPRVDESLQRHFAGESRLFASEYRIRTPGGAELWVISRGAIVERDAKGAPVRMIGTITDISATKQAERFEHFRSGILEMLARERSLPALLDAIVRGVEDLVPRSLCSVLLLDRERGLLQHGAAPSLPDFYNQAIHGVAIGPEVGSCGTAAHTGQRVIVEDIAHSPLWDQHRPFAEQAGLGACWSQPIVSADGAVLGTFAIYHRTPHHPEPAHLRLIEQTAALVSLAIERVRVEERLHLAASVFTHAREGIMITEPDGRIIDVNEAFTRITGYSREEALGQNPRFLKSGRQDRAFYAELWRQLIGNGHWVGEVWNRRKNGEHYAEMTTISAVRDEQGVTRQYVALFSDITELKEHEQQLQFNAHHDALTGLPNRVLLADRLLQAMGQARRRGQKLAVIYLDLDGFKDVNDRHGHGVGDQLLMAVAQGLRQALREGDTLARLGGDEFVAVLQDVENEQQMLAVASRVLAAAARPVSVDTAVVQVSASVGVTTYPQTEEVDADQLLRQADQAMYQAKLAGKNRVHVFDTEADRNVRGHHESLAHIRQALRDNAFVLHHQPKVNMRTGEVIGTEALIRWQHPERGLLGPLHFLPVIEDHPLSLEVGEWVMNTALSQMQAWLDQGLRLPVSINLGARELQQADFAEQIRRRLAAHPRVQPSDLTLEVLETSALGDLARVSQVMNQCRELGVQFALDDFGTGYSSLAYLKRLPVQQLKIDQSFVRDMLDDADDLAILEGVLGLSRAFRREVIAEGVETVEHGEMLLHLGCELAQGWGIARSMPADAIPDWVRTWQAPARWTQLAPGHSDALGLRLAQVKHGAWIRGVEAFLRGQRGEHPPLDARLCTFGQWLTHDAPRLNAPENELAVVASLHHRVHDLAESLCQMHLLGRAEEAVSRLPSLHALRDELLERLGRLPQAES